MKVSEEEEKYYEEEEKEHEDEEKEVDPFEEAVDANMERHKVDLDELVQMILMRMERKGGEEGGDEGGGVEFCLGNGPE